MKRPGYLVIVLATASMLAASPASAKQLRDPGSHAELEIPDAWALGQCPGFICAGPTTNDFVVRITGTSHGPSAPGEDEKQILQYLAQNLSDVKISQHATPVRWANFAGSEVWGHGTASGTVERFTGDLVSDKNGHAFLLFIIGTETAYNKYQPALQPSIQQMRLY